MKRILTYLYSGLSLFVGIWGIVSGLVSLNGQQTANNYFVYISLVVLTIFAPVAVYAISKRNRKDTLMSIKERFIEDEEMLPSTLSYLIDTIVSPRITNKGVSVEKIEVDITIDKSNDGHIANSTIIRTFSEIKAKHKISELDLLINHIYLPISMIIWSPQAMASRTMMANTPICKNSLPWFLRGANQLCLLRFLLGIE